MRKERVLLHLLQRAITGTRADLTLTLSMAQHATVSLMASDMGKEGKRFKRHRHSKYMDSVPAVLQSEGLILEMKNSS